MTEPVHIRITGIPVAKGRHRMTKTGHAFTPAKTREWERDARMVARQAMGNRPPLAGVLQVVITATFPVPASWPKWKQQMAREGYVGHTTKPDADNIAKAAKDAMNGIVWLDDAQVEQTIVNKRYGEVPAVFIQVSESNQKITAQQKTREVA